MEKIKELPNGVSSFRETREGNLYYVDKTMFLPTLEKVGRFLLLVRPRRFGKSLFVSMMKDYYDINRKDKFQEEFKGLSIAENPTKLQGYFQVLCFDFSQVGSDGNLAENFYAYCNNKLKEFLDYYSDFYPKPFVEEVMQIPTVNTKIDRITTYAKNNGAHQYLIIDEYDNFTNNTLSEKGESYYHKLTHADGFYREAFKAYKPSFERIFMIGVSPITLTDLTSGYNIAKNISHYESLNDIVGFSEKDVRKMIQYYKDAGQIEQDTEKLLSDMRPWYDGYCFSSGCLENSDARMYNSDMVLYYLSEVLARKRPPEDLVDPNTATDFNKLHQIIQLSKNDIKQGESLLEYVSANGYTRLRPKNNFTALQMTQTAFLPSLMYYYGLLTWGLDDKGRKALVIPNLNARKQYYDYMSLMVSAQAGVDSNKLDSLMIAAGEDGEWQPLMEYVAEKYHAVFNARIAKGGEMNVQIFMLGMLNTCDYYFTFTEAEMNGGYSDLFMMPLMNENSELAHSYVVELKYVKADATDTTIKKKMEEARKQVVRYAASPNAKLYSQGTKIHPIVMLFKGLQLLKMEEQEFDESKIYDDDADASDTSKSNKQYSDKSHEEIKEEVERIATLEMVRKMKAAGIDITTIQNISGLSTEEIKEL